MMMKRKGYEDGKRVGTKRGRGWRVGRERH
jgi:hypothetical protein